jgi:hypothetical protein
MLPSLLSPITRSFAVAFAVGAFAVAAQAQQAIPVTIGQPMAGRITTESPLLEGEDGIRFQRYSFRASGRKLRITLRSFELDSYLVVQKVTASGTETVGEDDDGGGDLDSQVVLDADGEYIVIARHFGANSTGGFTLLVEDAPPPEVVPRGLSTGQRVEETLRDTDPALADGTPGHEYRITLAAGTRLRLTARSTAFDVRLAVGRGEGSAFSAVASNDNGAGGTDALLDFVADASGLFVVRVTGPASAAGAYALTVERAR